MVHREEEIIQMLKSRGIPPILTKCGECENEVVTSAKLGGYNPDIVCVGCMSRM